MSGMSRGCGWFLKESRAGGGLWSNSKRGVPRASSPTASLHDGDRVRASGHSCCLVPHMLYINLTRFALPKIIFRLKLGSRSLTTVVSFNTGMNLVLGCFLCLGEFSCRSHKQGRVSPI
jgi:hypothetical protein